MPLSKIQDIGNQVIPNLGRRNILMNGDMQIAQRGTSALTSSSSSATYITDRFKIDNYSDATFTGQQVADSPTDFQFSTKVTTTGTDTSLAASQYQRFITAIEGQNMSHLNYGSSSAKTCTLTFHVKSSLTGQFYVFGFNSAANRSIVVGYTISSANTWEKKTLTIAGDTSGTWLTNNGAGMYFGWLLGSGTDRHTTTTDAFQAGFYMGKSDQVNLAGTNGATWQITGVQLEEGSVATEFEHRSFAEELLLCKRYFEVFAPIESQNGSVGIVRTRTSVNGYNQTFHFMEKRATPTGTVNFDRMHKPGVAYDTISSISLNFNTGETMSGTVSCVPSADSTISTNCFLGMSSGTGKITLSAEL